MPPRPQAYMSALTQPDHAPGPPRALEHGTPTLATDPTQDEDRTTCPYHPRRPERKAVSTPAPPVPHTTHQSHHAARRNDVLWRPGPASCTRESGKPDTLPTCLCDKLALPNIILVVVAIMFETKLFYRPPVLAVVKTPIFTVPEEPPFPYWV